MSEEVNQKINYPQYMTMLKKRCVTWFIAMMIACLCHLVVLFVPMYKYDSGTENFIADLRSSSGWMGRVNGKQISRCFEIFEVQEENFSKEVDSITGEYEELGNLLKGDMFHPTNIIFWTKVESALGTSLSEEERESLTKCYLLNSETVSLWNYELSVDKGGVLFDEFIEDSDISLMTIFRLFYLIITAITLVLFVLSAVKVIFYKDVIAKEWIDGLYEGKINGKAPIIYGLGMPTKRMLMFLEGLHLSFLLFVALPNLEKVVELWSIVLALPVIAILLPSTFIAIADYAEKKFLINSDWILGEIDKKFGALKRESEIKKAAVKKSIPFSAPPPKEYVPLQAPVKKYKISIVSVPAESIFKVYEVFGQLDLSAKAAAQIINEGGVLKQGISEGEANLLARGLEEFNVVTKIEEG